jgi:hypothetical protein
MKKIKLLLEIIMNGKNKNAKLIIALIIAFLTGNHSPELLELILNAE